MINASLNISVTRKSLELASLAGCRLGLVTDIVMGAGPGETCSPGPLLVLLSACKKKKKKYSFPQRPKSERLLAYMFPRVKLHFRVGQQSFRKRVTRAHRLTCKKGIHAAAL